MALTDTLIELGFMMAIYTIVTLSLNLEAGYFDIPNFGKAVFVFIGAWATVGIGGNLSAYLLPKLYPEINGVNGVVYNYTTGYHTNLHAALLDKSWSRQAVEVINLYLRQHPMLGLTLLLLVVIVGIGLGALLGLLASYPALRLREEYLAILLLSFSELMVVNVFYQTPSLLGPQGLWVPDFLGGFFIGPDGEVDIAKVARTFIAFTFIGTILIYILMERIANSPMGRLMRAIRDDNLAAISYGKDEVAVRKKVIMLSNAIAAFGGMMVALKTMTVQAMNFKRVYYTFFPWAMMILGGVANNAGTVLGVIAVWGGTRVINTYKNDLGALLGISPDIVAQFDKLLLGILILLILYFRPEGIIPEKPSKTTDFEELAEVSWKIEQGKLDKIPENATSRFLRRIKTQETILLIIALIVFIVWLAYII